MTIKSVFINCPFDNQYKHFIHLLIFLCFYFRCEPKLACDERDDKQRIEKIVGLIKTTDIGIHDISRIETSKKSLPRFNMPFELGMDYFNSVTTNKDKSLLVLDKQTRIYHKTLSDLQGFDIEAHNDNQVELVSIVRNFFVKQFRNSKIKGAQEILNEFKSSFSGYINEKLVDNKIKNLNDIKSFEFELYTKEYFELNPKSGMQIKKSVI